MKVRYDGREFELTEQMLFAEGVWIEKQSGTDLDEMSGTERTAAIVLVSLRRAGVMLTWADVMALGIGEFTLFDDEPVDATEADPQAPGVEAGTDEDGTPVGVAAAA